MGISQSAAELFRRDESARALGIELIEAGDHGATVVMTVRDDMCNGFGIMHGGMTFLFADSAMAFASNAAGQGAVAGSAEIDWFKPVSVRDELKAVAEPRWTSGKSSLWDITVSRRTEAGFEVVAMMRGRTRTVSRFEIRPQDNG